MNPKIQLNVENLAVATFETQSAQQPQPSHEQIRTCLNTYCAPYQCCA